MRFRKSTWIWLVTFVVAFAARIVLRRASENTGCLSFAALALAWNAGLILAWRGGRVLFRLVIRRLALRLAFSYFLIGIVPIPLLATLTFLASYLVANQYIANRLRREVTAVGTAALAGRADLPQVRTDQDGRIASSDVAWLPPGDAAPWLNGLARPGFLANANRLWLAVPSGNRSARLLDLSDPASPWIQNLAEATGYGVTAEIGTTSNEKNGFQISSRDDDAAPRPGVAGGEPASPTRRPRGAPPPGTGWRDREWIRAFYLETVLNAVQERARTGHNVAILQATTSPRVLADQMFSQGVAGVGRVFWLVFLGISAALLAVYLTSVVIAFILAGSIARSVNRLTRAAEAVSRGDFSVRVRSRSRDQIGDLARSFDGMADSIQRLLVDTARRERLESEIAMARTIQHKLLPPTEAVLPGFRVLAHFEPVAEIGGDYYDYLPMPDGRTAVALGDVSGHGLPTGLLVAMAKSALSTLLEAGHAESELFARLNELIHRSTEARHYMTLCLLSYDSSTRVGTLTNAGQLAPYRVSGGQVEALALPAFPLGLFADKPFPSRPYDFAPGDLVVLFSDGLVEGTDAREDAFGFDRLEGVLRAHSGAGARALMDAILVAVASHTEGRPPEDDRTIVILTLE